MATQNREPERTSTAWLVIALISFAGFALVTWLVATKTTIWFDQPILDTAKAWTGLKAFWNFVSDMSNYPMIVVGVGIVLWLLWKGRRREAVLVVVLLVAATAGSEAVKLLVSRPRPVETQVEGVVYSYPSGHILEALTIFGIIALLVWRSTLPAWVRFAVPAVLAVLVVIVGVARIALQAHYPSDVLGGALAGSGTLSTFAWLTSRDDADAPKDKAKAQASGPSPRKSA